ncbi:MAG TPA: copper homeostasis membrane protein CopD [Pseudolabrys sp.]|nr:copper homeostasis membrane protein CopD [Pseudolabrys sp.]
MTELLVIARFFHFAATVLATGPLFFRVFIADPAIGTLDAGAGEAFRASSARIVWIALALAVLSGAAWLVLLAANIYGATIYDVCAQGGVFTVAGNTRFGHIWCLRFVAAMAIAVLVPRSSVSRAPLNVVLLLLAAGLLISLAWVGHAGATPGINGDIHLISDCLHLLAAGAWVGGLLPLAMLLARAHSDERIWKAVPGAVRRFSVLGVACVGTLLLSGIVNALYLVVTPANLVDTDYGRLVLAKIALFAVMVCVATFNKLYLTPRLAGAGAARALQRNSLVELALGAVVLLVVGFLGTMPPASHGHAHAQYGPVAADAAFVHIHSEDGMADVTITPGRTGTSRATIRLWHEDLTELPARTVTLSLTPPGAQKTALARVARQLADGSWEADAIQLSERGNWTVKVDAQLSPAGRLELDAPIVIGR